MLKSIRIRLKPTPEQEILFWKSAGIARWSYNYYIDKCQEAYKNKEKHPKENDIRKLITILKRTTHPWLKEVGSNVIKQAVKDADFAYKQFFNHVSDKPKFKSKHKTKPSFYVNYESLTKRNGGFHGEKVGFVKTTIPLPKLISGRKHYSNPRIIYNGDYWYLSIAYAVNKQNVELTNETIGIDLGIKELAVCSNGMIFKNINKTCTIRRLEKKLKREQKKLSRKLVHNTKHKIKQKPLWKHPISECKNIQKQNSKIRLIYKRLTDIRTNHIHQATSSIVKTKPSKIVIEDLNISGMMKNRHLAKAIAQEKLYEFRWQLEYKTQFYGIQLIIADRYYPSSKMCSCCGHIKKNLKLSDRMYICPACGLKIDRDYNASINLAKYIA